MKRVTKGILIAAIAWLSLAGAAAGDNGVFDEAGRLYEQKDYAGAIAKWLQTVEGGYESSALYYNLGNAYFKSGDLGRAILFYLRARRLDPADSDIRHNLEFAKRFSTVQMEGVRLNPLHAFFESIVDEYRISTLGWIASAMFVLFVFTLIARFGLGYRNSAARAGIIITLLLTVAGAGLTTFKYQDDYLTRRAVIVADESPVYTGPSDQSDIELRGAPGLVVEIVEIRGDYYDVLFENRRRGWISKDLVELL